MKMTFCLRDANAKGATPLYAYVHWTSGTRHHQWKIATGERIEPRLWDRRRRKVKSGAALDGSVNERLAKIESLVRTTFSELEAHRRPLTPETVRGHYAIVSGKVALRPDRDFFEDYETFIEESRDKRQAGTLKIHNTVIAHLKAFAKKYEVRVTYEQCTVLMLDKFLAYLNNVAQINNQSAWKVVRTLRVFLRHAVEREWTANTEFQRFTGKRMSMGQSSEKVYVTAAELEVLKAMDLAHDRRLEVTRDLFVFQACTGLRYGDVQKVGIDHMVGDELHLVTGKNKRAIRVPLLPAARRILAKYEWRLPRRSNQKQNEYLKDLMAKADIDRPVVVVDFRGAQRIERTVPKYKLIGTHTAKRTFVSILRSKNITVESICRLTGNSRATIEKYILKDEVDMATELESITALV